MVSPSSVRVGTASGPPSSLSIVSVIGPSMVGASVIGTASRSASSRGADPLGRAATRVRTRWSSSLAVRRASAASAASARTADGLGPGLVGPFARHLLTAAGGLEALLHLLGRGLRVAHGSLGEHGDLGGALGVA